MSMPDLSKLMEQAKGFQDQLKTMQTEADKVIVEGKAGAAGIEVNAEMDGKHQLRKLTISDDAFKEGKEVVEGLILSAINDATKQVASTAKQKMMDMPNIGDLSKMFGK